MKEIKIPVPEKEDVDEFLVGILKFFLDSETKSKIYLYLRKSGPATAQETAKGANLYPSSAREALVSMAKSRIVTRSKLEVEGAGKKPYVYDAIEPSELLKRKISGIETRLNKLLNLDRYIEKEKTFIHPKIPYQVRIEKIIDDEGEEHMVIKSSADEEVKEKK